MATSTKSRNPNKRPGPKKKPGPARGGAGKWLWIGLAAIVVVFVVIVVATRGGGDGGDNSVTTSSSQVETAPVTVTGESLPTFSLTGTDPAIGMTAPDVTGQGFDGSPVSITNDGKAKVVVLGAHWCPHCQAEIPRIVSYLETDPMPADVGLYFVATGTNAQYPNYPPSAWLEKERWPSVVLADSPEATAAQAFGLKYYPYVVAIDAQGKVVGRASGEMSAQSFTALVNAARTGTPTDVRS